MTDRPDKQRLLANTIATAVAQFGTLGIAFLLAPVLILEFLNLLGNRAPLRFETIDGLPV